MGAALWAMAVEHLSTLPVVAGGLGPSNVSAAVEPLALMVVVRRRPPVAAVAAAVAGV